MRMMGVSNQTARVMLLRWAEKSLVVSAGPRAGIYFNRVVDRTGEKANATKALSMKYPSATLCGASVLHGAGWTTQIPSTIHAIVEERRSYVQIDGVTIHPRPLSWFRLMQSHDAWQSKENEDFATFGLRSLSPSWALADLYADESRQSWHPDEDDLDIPDESLDNLKDACQEMGASQPWMKQSSFERRQY